jgi:biotin operon repressor
MKIIAPEFTAKPKTKNKPSPVHLLAQAAVKDTLRENQGMFFQDLQAAVAKATECSRSTVRKVVEMHRSDGSVETRKEGRTIRCYWLDMPRQKADDILPVHRKVIAAWPHMGGQAVSVMEWSKRELEAA